MASILITRPKEDAGPLATAVRARGHEPILEPLMHIQFSDTPPPLDDITTLIFTSANGVRAFARASNRRDFLVFAVGDHTAAIAKDMGFSSIANARGDKQSLAELILREHPPGLGLHATAKGQGNLVNDLCAAGFPARRWEGYESAPARALSGSCRAGLAGNLYAAVLFFSPRTARIFCRLCREAGVLALPFTYATCLSAAVAQAADLPFRSLGVAHHPDLPSLLRCMDDQLRNDERTGRG
ncbi:MAG TPA: uroporphyrinogen-III synthase [Dongiaceae bacterium]|jgi:uroporphyrinogen-III synthase|nr:uroporphyrinogen-III synthase [Dongiaceae bacterium]